MVAIGIALVLAGAALLVAEAHAPAGVLGVAGGLALAAGAALSIGAAGGGVAIVLPVTVGAGAIAGLWLAVATRKSLATSRSPPTLVLPVEPWTVNLPPLTERSPVAAATVNLFPLTEKSPPMLVLPPTTWSLLPLMLMSPLTSRFPPMPVLPVAAATVNLSVATARSPPTAVWSTRPTERPTCGPAHS